MLGKGVVLGITALAGLAALAFSGHSNASASSAAPARSPGVSGGPPTIIPPPDVITEIADAVATADPAHMRQAADDVERKGFPQQANDLRATANAVEAAIRTANLPSAPPGAPDPSGGSNVSLPPDIQSQIAQALGTANPAILRQTADHLDTIGLHAEAERLRQAANAIEQGNQHVQTQAQSPAVDPAAALAHQVALNIAMSTKGNENKDLVLAYQTQEQRRGFYTGKLDGIYGPKIALAMAQDQHIVPPKPLYYPVNPTPAKNAYRQAILGIAATETDPERVKQWTSAANVGT